MPLPIGRYTCNDPECGYCADAAIRQLKRDDLDRRRAALNASIAANDKAIVASVAITLAVAVIGAVVVSIMTAAT